VQKRRFGSLDVDVPIVGLGTWQMERDDREQCIRAIRRAIDLGMTHIDTAELYGRGRVEEIVGEALAGYRNDVFLASKVHPDHATYAGTLLACEKSLRRLRTDRLDLYLLHWRGTLPLEETFRAFEALRGEGKIRSWGVSNFDVTDLEESIQIVGEGKIASNKVLYHLEERNAEHLLQIFCQRHRIAFVGYSPLGSGAFPGPDTKGGSLLEAIATDLGVSGRAIAIAFLIRRPGTFTIPKSGSSRHVADLVLGGALELTPEHVRAIDEAFPLLPPKSELPVI
jgi:diketogulonate reductase-like aldo/keto reductase